LTQAQTCTQQGGDQERLTTRHLLLQKTDDKFAILKRSGTGPAILNTTRDAPPVAVSWVGTIMLHLFQSCRTQSRLDS
jgi:hypothetical protein